MAEAYWAEGLQPGIGSPVLLELDPADADLARIEELGLMVFTSTKALIGYAHRESIGALGELSVSAAVG